MLKLLVFAVLLADLIAAEGVFGATAGLASGLAMDVIVSMATGYGISGIFSGWGLVDDVIMARLKLRWPITDKLLMAVAVENAVHILEEAYEQWDHTDQENRRYAAWLQRHNPDNTYVFGDVTTTDIYELGFSLGLLGYRRLPRTPFQEGLEWFNNLFAEV